MGIGKTLSNILNEQERNPNELAEKINESPSTIYSIIRRDNMKVDITVLAKICTELNVNMERFYNEYINDTTRVSNLTLSNRERELVVAYRQQPSMQEAVDRLLGIEPEAIETKKQA